MALTLVALTALVAALVLTPIAATVATHLGVVDHPGPLKVHRRPVPYLGGLAVLGAVAVAAGWRVGLWLLPLALACALGLADDITNLDARLRLAAEAAIGAIAGGLIGGGSLLGVVAGAGVVALLVFGSIDVNSRSVIEAVLFATVLMYACEIIVGTAAASSSRRLLQCSTLGTLLIITLRGVL